jgi:hypothetical protein
MGRKRTPLFLSWVRSNLAVIPLHFLRESRGLAIAVNYGHESPNFAGGEASASAMQVVCPTFLTLTTRRKRSRPMESRGGD